jgi:hypothetical protein
MRDVQNCVPAVAASLRGLRRRLNAWLGVCDRLDPDTADDLVLAVG